jgi:hypothetical protein
LDERAKKNLKCRYEGQYDYLYENDPDDPNKILGIPLSKKPHWLMNTINKTLEWEVAGHPEKIVKFDLVRAKVQFEYTYIKDNVPHRRPIGGELIDISFPHRKDFRLSNFLKNYDKWVANYRLTLNETGESFVMKAESVDGIAADIYEVVFEQFDRPWADPKYEKRINRLFLLGIIDMISVKLTNQQIEDYLGVVQKEVIQPLNGVYPLDTQAANALIKQLDDTAQGLAQKYPQMTIPNKIWHGIAKLVEEELLRNAQSDDEKQFGELLTLVKKNLATMAKLNNLNLPKIDKRNIYNADMSSLF